MGHSFKHEKSFGKKPRKKPGYNKRREERQVGRRNIERKLENDIDKFKKTGDFPEDDWDEYKNFRQGL